MSLSENRHHEIRIKNKVKKYYNGWANSSPRNLGRVAHAKKICSCLSCGNRRKHEGPTIHEKGWLKSGKD